MLLRRQRAWRDSLAGDLNVSATFLHTSQAAISDASTSVADGGAQPVLNLDLCLPSDQSILEDRLSQDNLK